MGKRKAANIQRKAKDEINKNKTATTLPTTLAELLWDTVLAMLSLMENVDVVRKVLCVDTNLCLVSIPSALRDFYWATRKVRLALIVLPAVQRRFDGLPASGYVDLEGRRLKKLNEKADSLCPRPDMSTDLTHLLNEITELFRCGTGILEFCSSEQRLLSALLACLTCQDSPYIWRKALIVLHSLCSSQNGLMPLRVLSIHVSLTIVCEILLKILKGIPTLVCLPFTKLLHPFVLRFRRYLLSFPAPSFENFEYSGSQPGTRTPYALILTCAHDCLVKSFAMQRFLFFAALDSVNPNLQAGGATSGVGLISLAGDILKGGFVEDVTETMERIMWLIEQQIFETFKMTEEGKTKSSKVKGKKRIEYKSLQSGPSPSRADLLSFLSSPDKQDYLGCFAELWTSDSIAKYLVTTLADVSTSAIVAVRLGLVEENKRVIGRDALKKNLSSSYSNAYLPFFRANEDRSALLQVRLFAFARGALLQLGDVASKESAQENALHQLAIGPCDILVNTFIGLWDQVRKKFEEELEKSTAAGGSALGVKKEPSAKSQDIPSSSVPPSSSRLPPPLSSSSNPSTRSTGAGFPSPSSADLPLPPCLCEFYGLLRESVAAKDHLSAVAEEVIGNLL